MKERITPHLWALIKAGSKAMRKQFVKIKQKPWRKKFSTLDPLGEEEKFSPVKGLVHKYRCTALIKTSNYCAAHCQFCTRCRDIGTARGNLSKEDINNIVSYIKDHPEIYDVILSGGDPFFTPNVTYKLLEELEPIKTVRVIRIGTRLPVHSPKSFNMNKGLRDVLEKLEKMSRFNCPIIVLVHFNHPDELTKDTEDVIWMLRSRGISVLSQTVFLRGINDDAKILEDLFTKLHKIGVLPYYIYRCDYVSGLEHFVVPFMKEVKIMIQLWKRIPGLALPQYIFDAPGGRGKIRIPFLSPRVSRSFTDIDGKKIKI